MQAELLEKLKIRDPDTVVTWVEQHHSDIFRLLKNLTRHTETAEDLTQQTFIQAMNALPKFQARSTMRTWLHRIAFREYAAWRRKHQLLAPINPAWGKPDPAFSEIDTNQGILDALQRLKPAQREAFLLHEVQELTIQEIVQITGASAGTIKSRLHAREKLKRELATTFPQVIHEL